MHAISHNTTPRCLSCPQPIQMCTLNSCKKGFHFSSVPTTPSEESVDQTIEETVNNDTQTPGETKVFSLKPGAVSTHYLMAEYRAVYLGTMRDMIGQGSSKLSHPDLQGPIYLIQPDLVSLSTRTMAPPAVVKDLLRALKVGEEAYQTFKQTRLDDDLPSVKFHDKMTKQRLKTSRLSAQRQPERMAKL